MGNICSDSQDTSSPVVVYGDYFDADTRIILAILTHCHIPHKLQDQSNVSDAKNNIPWISHNNK